MSRTILITALINHIGIEKKNCRRATVYSLCENIKPYNFINTLSEMWSTNSIKNIA